MSTCERPQNTKLGKVLSCSKRLPSLKTCGSLITWSTWSHVTVLKIYIIALVSQELWPVNLIRVLNYMRRFSTPKLKSSPTSCYRWIIAFTISYSLNVGNATVNSTVCLKIKFQLNCFFKLSWNISVKEIFSFQKLKIPHSEILFHKRLPHASLIILL